MKKTVFCPIRKAHVAAQPEELIRQHLILHMTNELGYSAASLVVEKGLRQMPHLALIDHKAPARRADLLYFAANIHPQFALYPLLLIECKAVKLTSTVIRQVTGYNHYVKSYFIAIANGEEVRTGWYDVNEKAYKFVDRLPSFQELLSSIKNLNTEKQSLAQEFQEASNDTERNKEIEIGDTFIFKPEG